MNVIVAVCPVAKSKDDEVIDIVGSFVSTAIVTVLFVSAPSILELPNISLNLLLATLITPFTSLLIFGVKTPV